MSDVIELKLNNELIEVENVCNVFEELGGTHNLPAKVVMDMCLASDEIITNIISYGYEDNKKHVITVRIRLKDDYLVAEIEDDARPFNPLELPEVDVTTPFEEKKIGGLGIHLVRNLMDRFEYKRVNNNNILLFGKKIK